MVFLGFGKYARADKIYALEPLPAGERGSGQRTRVWIEGVAEPVIASRTERTILLEMGVDSATATKVLDDAIDLSGRLVEQDRKSTRLNSSHEWISYAVFCLQKKNEQLAVFMCKEIDPRCNRR